jgi:uncharacterized membrane protein
MQLLLLRALGIGVSCGLRTFTGPAALSLKKGGLGTVLPLLSAAGEYVVDLLPQTPSRTKLPGVAGRIASSIYCGREIAKRAEGSQLLGVAAAIAGALVGTYGGHAARLAAIEEFGAIPAALAEDVVALGLALAIAST